MKVRDLFEADPKKKEDDDDKKKSKPTKDQEKKVDLGDMFDKKTDRPLTRKERDEQEFGKESRKERKLRLASKGDTDRATRGINMDDESMNHLRNLHRNMPDAGDDEEVRPKPPENELAKYTAADVPAVISNAMVAAGFVDPDFHLVSNLPGNMSRAIKQLGKALFDTFTTTPTERISMVGNLGGQGPNSRMEVNAVASFLKKHGKDKGPGDIDFNAVMPGYTAKIHNWSAEGTHFMMVKDHAGDYIYAWPEKDTKKGGATGIDHDKGDQKRLK